MICRWCHRSLITSAEQASGVCVVCNPVRNARLESEFNASPVEGRRGDPEHGGSPPAGGEPVDQKAPTVPAPAPTVDMDRQEP